MMLLNFFAPLMDPPHDVILNGVVTFTRSYQSIHLFKTNHHQTVPLYTLHSYPHYHFHYHHHHHTTSVP